MRDSPHPFLGRRGGGRVYLLLLLPFPGLVIVCVCCAMWRRGGKDPRYGGLRPQPRMVAEGGLSLSRDTRTGEEAMPGNKWWSSRHARGHAKGPKVLIELSGKT